MDRIGDKMGRIVPIASGRELQQRSQTLPENLRPIDQKELAVRLVATLEIWKLPDNWPQISAFYREALEDVPADLVEIALQHCRRTLKWFPKPCELREPIERLLNERRRSYFARIERERHIETQMRERADWLESTGRKDPTA